MLSQVSRGHWYRHQYASLGESFISGRQRACFPWWPGRTRSILQTAWAALSISLVAAQEGFISSDSLETEVLLSTSRETSSLFHHLLSFHLLMPLLQRWSLTLDLQNSAQRSTLHVSLRLVHCTGLLSGLPASLLAAFLLTLCSQNHFSKLPSMESPMASCGFQKKAQKA